MNLTADVFSYHSLLSGSAQNNKIVGRNLPRVGFTLTKTFLNLVEPVTTFFVNPPVEANGTKSDNSGNLRRWTEMKPLSLRDKATRPVAHPAGRRQKSVTLWGQQGQRRSLVSFKRLFQTLGGGWSSCKLKWASCYLTSLQEAAHFFSDWCWPLCWAWFDGRVPHEWCRDHQGMKNTSFMITIPRIAFSAWCKGNLV